MTLAPASTHSPMTRCQVAVSRSPCPFGRMAALQCGHVSWQALVTASVAAMGVRRPKSRLRRKFSSWWACAVLGTGGTYSE